MSADPLVPHSRHIHHGHSAAHTRHSSRDSRLNPSISSSSLGTLVGGSITGVHSSTASTSTAADGHASDEAAFWIPQATPDGRLFYYNTLTGVSKLELPLDGGSVGPMSAGIPTSRGGHSLDMGGSLGGLLSPISDYGPRDRSNVYIPDQTPMPAELGPPDGLTGRRGANGSGAAGLSLAGSAFLNEGGPARSITWSRLLEGISGAVERYRRAINNNDQAEFVPRAEHISDHLRLLFVAGSGSTDNNSGSPSVVSSNKALYPHFRLSISRFSKLVLSSHIAASDWPPTDSFIKCLAEAKGMMQSVQSYVEVARRQQGGADEMLPRLVPVFESGVFVGGNWRGAGLYPPQPAEGGSMLDDAMLEDDDDDVDEPDEEDVDAVANPDGSKPVLPPPSAVANRGRRHLRAVISRLERLQPAVADELGVLAEFEVIARDAQVVSAVTQETVAAHVCQDASRLLERVGAWSLAIEAIDFSRFCLSATTQALAAAELAEANQTTYDLVADLMMACQDVSSPLPDEWCRFRTPSFTTRLQTVVETAKKVELSMTAVLAQLRTLLVIVMEPVESETAEPVRTGSGGSSKVKRFFGEVPPEPASVSTSAPDVPPFLRLDYENEIAYDATRTAPVGASGPVAAPSGNVDKPGAGAPHLRGGTLMALVEQLTRHDRLDSLFNSTFLLTYKSFTTAQTLFEMLMTRWSIQPPAGLSGADLQLWTDRKQKPIRFRVVNILKSWIETYWVEDDSAPSRELLERVHGFARDEVVKTNTPGSGPLLSVIDLRLKSDDVRSSKKIVQTVSSSTPAPIMPKNVRKVKFLDIDPIELARQLTIIEARLYCQIRPSECLNKTWQRQILEDEPEPAPNIKALIYHSNQLTNWVSHMILMQKDLRPRVIVIKHFVAVANRCRQLNNFSTLTSIISALGTAPIHRLHRTWAAVSAKTLTTLESLRKLMSSTKNFAEYRDALHKAVAPCIPFFGVYLTDLTFIEDGISSMIKKTNLINITKRGKTADIIRSIQAYQNVPYPLQAVQPLIDYVHSNLQSAKEMQDDMYKLSLQVEPRERDDDRITRVVAESGL